MRAKTAEVKYVVESDGEDSFAVVAKVKLVTCPTFIMASVIADGLDALGIRAIAGLQLKEPTAITGKVPELVPLDLKGSGKKRTRKVRADKGVKKGPRKKKRGRRSGF